MYYVPTTEEWQSYLDREITSNNYFIFFGLQSLSKSDFDTVAGALVQGDISPQDLHRLGSFTPEEIESFVKSIITNWNNPKISSGVTEISGYNYLLSLGLETFFEQIKETEKLGRLPVNKYRDVEFNYGSGSSYADKFELISAWQAYSKPVGLLECEKETIAQVFPKNEYEVKSLPINNSTPEKQELLWQWYNDVFQDLLGLDVDEKLFFSIFSANQNISTLRKNPSISEFILGSRKPYFDAQLLLHQEAISRSALGEYTLLEMEERVNNIKEKELEFFRLPRDISNIYFNLTIISKWCEYTSNTIEDLEFCFDVFNAFYEHKEVIKKFIEGCYNGARSNMSAKFPPAIIPKVFNDFENLIL